MPAETQASHRADHHCTVVVRRQGLETGTHSTYRQDDLPPYRLVP